MINEQEFLKPEVRCDFLVSEKRKKVWKVELDILEEFIRICQKHDLKYFLFAGSMLGAVRHQGVIPWDDDIDVAMPREDYEELLRVAPAELQEQYVLVTPDNEGKFCWNFSKICNKNTAAMETWFWKYGCSHAQGIFLDIFPFDHVADSKIRRKLHHFQIKVAHALLLMRKDYHINENNHGKCAIMAFNVIKRFISRLSMEKRVSFHRKVVTKYNKRRTGTVSYIGDGYIPKIFYLTDWVEDLVDAPFEYLTVKIPKQYDECLTKQFGDWHEFVKGGSCHEGIFFDPDRSYTEYLGRFEEFKDTSREL